MSRWHPQAWSITTEAPRPDAELVAELDLVVKPSRRNYSLKGIGDTRISVVGRAVPAPASS